MEGFYGLFRVFDVSGWLPRAVRVVISRPFHQVLAFPIVKARVTDLFDFPFLFPFYFYRRRFVVSATRNAVWLQWRQQGYVEDWMDVDGGRQFKTIVEWTNDVFYFIWAESLVTELSTRVFQPYVLRV